MIFLLEKPEGLTLMRDWPWYDKLICKRTYNRISYVNKMFSNLSVGWRRQLSLPKRAYFADCLHLIILPKRALQFARFKMLICSQTSVLKRASFAVCISCCFTEEFKNKSHIFFSLRRITNFSWFLNKKTHCVFNLVT